MLAKELIFECVCIDNKKKQCIIIEERDDNKCILLKNHVYHCYQDPYQLLN